MVDFNKLSMLSRISDDILAGEYQHYDSNQRHAFKLGFNGGYNDAGKDPDKDAEALEAAAREDVKRTNPWFDEAQKEACHAGYMRGYAYKTDWHRLPANKSLFNRQKTQEISQEKAVAAFRERIKVVSARRMTDGQREAVTGFLQSYGGSDTELRKDATAILYKEVMKFEDVRRCSASWRDDAVCELADLVYGRIREDHSNGMKR